MGTTRAWSALRRADRRPAARASQMDRPAQGRPAPDDVSPRQGRGEGYQPLSQVAVSPRGAVSRDGPGRPGSLLYQPGQLGLATLRWATHAHGIPRPARAGVQMRVVRTV